MMRYLFPILLLILLPGCRQELVEKPDNLIPPERMSAILYDLAIMEAIDGTYRGTLDRNGIEPVTWVYEKHGVDSLQFAKSDFYYASRPAAYERIYQEVSDRLSRERDSIGEVIRKGNEAGREAVSGKSEKDSL